MGVVVVTRDFVLPLVVLDDLLDPLRHTVQLRTESSHYIPTSSSAHLECFFVVVVKHNPRQVSERLDFVGIVVILIGMI